MRWSKNILLAVVIALLTVWLAREWIVGDLFRWFDIDPGFVILLLFMGFSTTVVIWALGLTRLSSAQAAQRTMVILSYLEQAVRLNLPLNKLLIAAEASEPGWIASRIRRMRRQLDHGQPLSDSLSRALPNTSRRTLGLMRAAEQTGRLGPELTLLLRHEQNRQSLGLARNSFLRRYPVAMTVVIVFIVSFITIFVMPKYQQIFHDFGVSLPPLTVLLIRFTDDPIQVMVIIAAAIMLLLSAQQLRQRLHWSGPLGWFTTHRDLADICHVLAQQLRAGVPLPNAIHATADLSVSRPLKRKLTLWVTGIESGQPAFDAAKTAGLPGLISGLTLSDETFEFLSRYYAGKFSRTMTLIRAAAIPVVTLCFGLVVALVALALFLPMVKLIETVGAHPSSYSSWL